MKEKMFNRALRYFRRGDGHMREIVDSALVAFGIKVVAAAVTFGLYVLLARLLGASGAGLYFLSLSIVSVLAAVGRLGMDSPLTRFVAAHATAGEWSHVHGVFRLSLRTALLSATSFAVLAFTLAPWLAQNVFEKPELAPILRTMAVALVPVTISVLFSKALQGLKRIPDAMLILSVWAPLFTMSALPILVPRWGALGAAWSYCLGALVALAVAVARWRSATAGTVPNEVSFPPGRLRASSVPLLAATGLQMVMQWSPMLILGPYVSASEMGVFGSAQRASMLLTLILVAVNSIAAPKFAAFHSSGQLSELGHVAQRSTVLMIAAALPLFLIFLLVPGWVMGIFGEEFIEGSTVLTILAIGQFANVIGGSIGTLLLMTGNEKPYYTAFLFAAIVNVGLCLALIPGMGAVGAAIAAAVAVGVVNVLCVYFAWNSVGITTIPLLSKAKP